jgi:MazG family protein
MSALDELLEIMARLRDPERGCPWDVEQSFETIAPYTIEEAYEVDDAIRRGDLDALREELGDLLLQVVYHARMAEEQGAFAFEDVARAECEKLVRRHPHVFGGARIDTAAEQTRAWEEHKARERAQKAAGDGAAPSALDGVAPGMPALLRAQKLLRRAARAGLVPRAPDPAAVQARIARLAGSPPLDAAKLGALLLACVELAEASGLEAETALRDAAARFETDARAREKP